MAAPLGTTNQKSKDHRNRRNPHTAEEWGKRKRGSASPERRLAQLHYRLDSIEESVKRGRQQYEGKAEADVKRLRNQLDALEAQQ